MLLWQHCSSGPKLSLDKETVWYKSFQLSLSFGHPFSVGPLQSPIRKPTAPSWGQFFCQDHWRSYQSQCQNFCVPPGLASPPVQMNCREWTLQSTFLESHGKDRERRQKHRKGWTEKKRDIADKKWTYMLIEAQTGDTFCQIFVEGWFAQLQPEATLTASTETLLASCIPLLKATHPYHGKSISRAVSIYDAENYFRQTASIIHR